MPSEPRAEPLRGRLDGFDGKYHYVCERGHHVSSSAPFLDTCPAQVPISVPNTINTMSCGAEIVHRTVDYRGEGDVI